MPGRLLLLDTGVEHGGDGIISGLKPRNAGTPKVPMALDKIRIKDEAMAGHQRKVILRSISSFPAPRISPISSSSELMERKLAEISRYA